MIDGRNFFDQPVNNSLITCNNQMISTGKQQALDANPKAIQQINFAANLDRDGNTAMFFIIEQDVFY